MAYSSTPSSIIKRSILAIVKMFQRQSITVEMADDLFNVTNGRWDSNREDCLEIEFRFNVRTLGWMTSLQKSKTENWVKTMDFRYDEENFFVWGYYTIVRETKSLLKKLPLCRLGGDAYVVDYQISNNSISLFNSTLVDEFLYNSTGSDDYVDNCTGLKVHTRQNLDANGRNILAVVTWDCVDDVLPERTEQIIRNDFAKKLIYGCSGFAVSSLAFALFFNIPNVEFQSLPGYNLGHTLVMCCLALGALFICPIAEDFDNSRVALKYCSAFFWWATFSWGSLSAFHFWFLFAYLYKNPKKDVYYSSILAKVYLLLGYGVPGMSLMVMIFMNPDDMDVDDNNGGMGCIPLSTSGFFSIVSVPFLAFVVSNFLFLSASVYHVYDVKVGGHEDCFSFLVFYWVQVGIAINLALMWAVNLIAQSWKSTTLWETFLILSCMFGFLINVIFIAAQRILSKYNIISPSVIKW